MTTARGDDTFSRTSEPTRDRILYITFNGVLEPLGRLQVLSYLLGLSRRGFKFTLISLERERDLSNNFRVAELTRELEDYGVKWVRCSFHSNYAGRSARACKRVYRVGVCKGNTDKWHVERLDW